MSDEAGVSGKQHVHVLLFVVLVSGRHVHRLLFVVLVSGPVTRQVLLRHIQFTSCAIVAFAILFPALLLVLPRRAVRAWQSRVPTGQLDTETGAQSPHDLGQ